MAEALGASHRVASPVERRRIIAAVPLRDRAVELRRHADVLERARRQGIGELAPDRPIRSLFEGDAVGEASLEEGDAAEQVEGEPEVAGLVRRVGKCEQSSTGFTRGFELAPHLSARGDPPGRGDLAVDVAGVPGKLERALERFDRTLVSESPASGLTHPNRDPQIDLGRSPQGDRQGIEITQADLRMMQRLVDRLTRRREDGRGNAMARGLLEGARDLVVDGELTREGGFAGVACLDPAGDRMVQSRAAIRRDVLVEGLAKEDVLEAQPCATTPVCPGLELSKAQPAGRAEPIAARFRGFFVDAESGLHDAQVEGETRSAGGLEKGALVRVQTRHPMADQLTERRRDAGGLEATGRERLVPRCILEQAERREVVDQLGEVKRVSARRTVEPVDEAVARPGVLDLAPIEPPHSVLPHAVDGDRCRLDDESVGHPGHVGPQCTQRFALIDLGRPDRADRQELRRRGPSGERVEESQRRMIGPLDVLDDENRRLLRTDHLDRVEDLTSHLCRLELDRVELESVLGKERGKLRSPARCSALDDRSNARATRIRVGAREIQRGFSDREIGRLLAEALDALALSHEEVCSGRLDGLLGERRLAAPRRPDDQHESPAALTNLARKLRQLRELGGAPDEGPPARGAQRRESILRVGGLDVGGESIAVAPHGLDRFAKRGVAAQDGAQDAHGLRQGAIGHAGIRPDLRQQLVAGDRAGGVGRRSNEAARTRAVGAEPDRGRPAALGAADPA